MSETHSADALRDEIDRVAQSYDRLQYDSRPFPHSQPARLAALAQYFGLDAAPIATARVLELGCASGGNLIPHAVHQPDARFVGADIGRAQILSGQARIERLGLTNIELRCESLTDIDESWGSFEYIICHGVYSWVSAAVQDAIFRVIRERLSPRGVCCVSYNVLPGWRMLQPFRDACRLAIPDTGDSAARVAAARDLLGFMHSRTIDAGSYGESLRCWGEQLSTAPDYYLAHEYLADENAPSFVRDVAAAAARHQLTYLSDCDISTMMSANYGPEVAHYVQTRTNGDLIATEQYLDILTGRTFRQSIFVAEERMRSVDRLKSPAGLFGRHFVTHDSVSIEQEGDQYVVKGPGGAWIRTPSSAAAAGIARLIERHPASSTVEDCINAIAGRGSEQDRTMLLDALYTMVSSYMLIPTAEAVEVAPPGDRPRAGILARLDAAEGAEATTNNRHELVPIGPVMRVLLPVMDGTLDHAALIDVLVREAVGGRLSFTRDDRPVTDADGARQIAEEQLPGILTAISRLGLLERQV